MVISFTKIIILINRKLALRYWDMALLLGPLLGKLADKFGRNKIIPIGIFVGALSAIILGMDYSLLISCICIATLSLGFDLTQPLYAAIITTLSPKKEQRQAYLHFSFSWVTAWAAWFLA